MAIVGAHVYEVSDLVSDIFYWAHVALKGDLSKDTIDQILLDIASDEDLQIFNALGNISSSTLISKLFSFIIHNHKELLPGVIEWYIKGQVLETEEASLLNLIKPSEVISCG